MMRPLLDRLKSRKWRLASGCGLIIFAANLWAWGLTRNDVVAAAYAIPDGGGYCRLGDTGVLQSIRHNGSVILAASEGGSYCCGFTFQVAMRVAEQRGLLAKKPVADLRRMQRAWYGSNKGTEAKQCAVAVSDAGIGREINREDAKSGDFMIFFRTTGFGHSVVFLGWIRDRDGQIVGVRYRSSQPDTDGVADYMEYFSDVGMGTIDRQTVFVARLNRPWWSRVLYPLAG